jgi:hypothetical protein
MEGKCHPQAWVEIYESHTPYEWKLQRARAIVDPWGVDRDDRRAALNTMASHPIEEETFDLLKGCGLKINEHEEEVGPAQMRALLES